MNLMKNTSLFFLSFFCLMLMACGGKGNGKGEASSDATGVGNEDISLDSAAMAKLEKGPFAGIATFMEWQANYLLGKASSTGIPASEFVTAERRAIEEATASEVEAWKTGLIGRELPTDVDNDNFEGNVRITKVQSLIQDWYIGVDINTKGGEVKSAPLVFCDSNGDPLFCICTMRHSGGGMHAEWNVNQLKDPKKGTEMLAEYRILKYISKVKVVDEDDFSKYEKAANRRRAHIEKDIAKERGEGNASAQASDGQSNTEASGARATFDLYGPVASCTWQERYQTVSYAFGQDGDLTAYNGQPAAKAFTSIKRDAKGRFVKTEREDEETYTYETVEYRYDATDGRIVEISKTLSDGKQHSLFGHEPKTLFLKTNSYFEEYAEEGEEVPTRIKGTITYTVTATDNHGNWTSRSCKDNREGESWTETRTIKYY